MSKDMVNTTDGGDTPGGDTSGGNTPGGDTLGGGKDSSRMHFDCKVEFQPFTIDAKGDGILEKALWMTLDTEIDNVLQIHRNHGVVSVEEKIETLMGYYEQKGLELGQMRMKL